MRVLIVDDVPMIADTLGLILKGRGFDATVVYSGEDLGDHSKAAIDYHFKTGHRETA
jgi:DNA-binding response OmpR family regulator